MNRKSILVYIEKKLKSYNLTKIERARFYDQAAEVIEECGSEFETIEDIDNLIEEVFELNDVNPSLKMKRGILRVLIGLELIIVAIAMLFFKLDLGILDLLALLFINLTIVNLFKRYFFSSIIFCILSLLFINHRIDVFSQISFLNLLMGLIILFIGLKLIFKNDKVKIKHQTYKQHYHHKEIHKEIHDQIKEDFYKTYAENVNSENLDQEIERDIMFVKNIFGGSNNNLKGEKVKHILVENIFGGVEMNFKDFDFNSGDLTIDCHNSCGGISIIVNSKTEVIVMNQNILGGTSNENKVNRDEVENTIYIKGKNVIGGISVEYQ